MVIPSVYAAGIVRIGYWRHLTSLHLLPTGATVPLFNAFAKPMISPWKAEDEADDICLSLAKDSYETPNQDWHFDIRRIGRLLLARCPDTSGYFNNANSSWDLWGLRISTYSTHWGETCSGTVADLYKTEHTHRTSTMSSIDYPCAALPRNIPNSPCLCCTQ
jgi:hypothetical protein